MQFWLHSWTSDVIEGRILAEYRNLLLWLQQVTNTYASTQESFFISGINHLLLLFSIIFLFVLLFYNWTSDWSFIPSFPDDLFNEDMFPKTDSSGK